MNKLKNDEILDTCSELSELQSLNAFFVVVVILIQNLNNTDKITLYFKLRFFYFLLLILPNYNDLHLSLHYSQNLRQHRCMISKRL